MPYEMIIMSSTSQLYCQTKGTLKSDLLAANHFFVIFCKNKSFSAMDIVL